MESLVEQLYFNKINVHNRNSNKNKKTAELIKQVTFLEDKLLKGIKEDQQRKAVFEFIEAFTQLASITANDVYSVGFREGTKFTYEVLQENTANNEKTSQFP